MVERVKRAVKKSAPKEKEYTFLEVTVKTVYAYPKGYINGWDTKTVIKDWFEDYPMGMYHASREGSRVGNSERVIDVKEITKEEFVAHSKIPTCKTPPKPRIAIRY